MRPRRGFPGQLLLGPLRACTGPREGGRVVEQLASRLGQRRDVARRNDPARAEAPDRLCEPADVVRDHWNAGAERPEQGPALVDLGPVRKERDRRVAQRAVDLVVREIAEPPLRTVSGGLPVSVDALQRVAGDEEPGPVDGLRCLDRVADPLVRPDDPEREEGAAIVASRRVARKHRVRDHAQPFLVSQLCELVATPFAVDDDPLEAAEEPAPELPLLRRAPGEEVVGREDERLTDAEKPVVELRGGKPLQMGDVGPAATQAGEPYGVLDELERDPEPRAPKDPRADGIEELAPPVALRLGRFAEAEGRGNELDVRPRLGERRRERVVVLGREGRRVGEEDAHGLLH